MKVRKNSVRKLVLLAALLFAVAPMANFSSALASGPRMDDNGAP